MPPAPAIAARCDDGDRLSWADEPLAALQRACGGQVPGIVAVPELLALVRAARLAARPLVRTVRAQDSGHAITASARAEPDATGCRLTLTGWTVGPLPPPPHSTSFAGLGSSPLQAMLAPVERIVAAAAAFAAAAEPAPEPYATYAGDIGEAARHLQALLHGLGAAAAAAEGDHGRGQGVDLAEQARRAAAMLRAHAERRRIVVALPEAPVATAAPTCDPGKVRQILVNLLGNALRYAPEGSTVRLAGTCGPQWTAFSVADEGPGLQPGEQARVFDKYERLGRSGDGGSGLGLTIARRLARAMGGELSVDSLPGQGSRFTLRLPSA